MSHGDPITIIMPHARLVPHCGSIQTQLYACVSINVYGCDEMNTQIEPLSDDEDSTYATEKEYNSHESKSS